MDLFRLLLGRMNEQRMLFWLLAAFALLPLFTAYADLPFWNDVAMRIMLLGMAAMGLNLILGYGGMVSFGHAAFIGIGAYCSGISQFYGLFNGLDPSGVKLEYVWCARPCHRLSCPSNQRHLLHHDYACLRADAIFFLCQP